MRNLQKQDYLEKLKENTEEELEVSSASKGEHCEDMRGIKVQPYSFLTR